MTLSKAMAQRRRRHVRDFLSIKSFTYWSIQMANAGFVYTPQTLGDDTVTCYYCELCLSGWDEDDDPM